MKTYVFKLEIIESDLNGDEFWENAIEEDPTGINPLKREIVEALENHGIFPPSTDVKQLVQLDKYDSRKS